jgi:mycothiol S-conjugate amidase
VDPTESFWFGLPTEVARDAHPFDDYVLARSLVGEIPGPGEFEHDLFAGVPGRT